MDEKIELMYKKIGELYDIVNELEGAFEGRHFTPDGHLVGSIGEVLAAHYYDLDLLQASAKTHDAISKCGKMIQIKATQGKRVALREETEHLIVLKIMKNGKGVEIFNGPGSLVWNNCGKLQTNGQRSISINKIGKLMSNVSLSERLIRKNI